MMISSIPYHPLQKITRRAVVGSKTKTHANQVVANAVHTTKEKQAETSASEES